MSYIRLRWIKISFSLTYVVQIASGSVRYNSKFYTMLQPFPQWNWIYTSISISMDGNKAI